MPAKAAGILAAIDPIKLKRGGGRTDAEFSDAFAAGLAAAPHVLPAVLLMVRDHANWLQLQER